MGKDKSGQMLLPRKMYTGEQEMIVKIYPSFIELCQLSEKQKDYLSTFSSYAVICEHEGKHRIFGDFTRLYTILLLISQRYDIEILAQ